MKELAFGTPNAKLREEWNNAAERHWPEGHEADQPDLANLRYEHGDAPIYKFAQQHFDRVMEERVKLETDIVDEEAISFGLFRLFTPQRLLLDGDKPVRLGSRAFDILITLVERAGEVVEKEELIARAWPSTLVAESNLRIQIHALRRALGDGQNNHRYVIGVPGRGYSFVAPTRIEAASPQALKSATSVATAPHNLPLALTRMVDRDDAVAGLVSGLSRHRLMTIVGPGGIGKTTVALAAAERLIGHYEHGVWLVDLAPISDPRLVPATVASVLGLKSLNDDALSSLVSAIRDWHALLLLDNCEHVIDAAASLANAVLSKTSGVKILATSREHLRVAGERMYRLGPLSCPPSSSDVTATEAGAYPAVRLFVERASEVVENFALTDINAPLVVEICRMVDGLPLAIEFSASCVGVFGVNNLVSHLMGSLPLLGRGRRTAPLRQRTMHAVVDWSYGLLDGNEQRFLRRLGLFAGGFTLEAAKAVAFSDQTAGANVINLLADLVAKSLIVADVNGAEPRFGLLETTRAYVLGKLTDAEAKEVARSHARYFRSLMVAAVSDGGSLSDLEIARYARELANVRAALDWSFSGSGEAEIGLALTAAYCPIGLDLSLLFECRERIERALLHLGPNTTLPPSLESQLHITLGIALIITLGPADRTKLALNTGLQLAERNEDLDAQLCALRSLWAFQVNVADYTDAQSVAEKLMAAAVRSGAPIIAAAAHRIMGYTMIFMGRQGEAFECLEKALELGRGSDGQRPRLRFLYDQQLLARATLARSLWLRGFVDEARNLAEACLTEAQTADDKLAFCFILNLSICPITLMTGDFVAAQRHIQLLIDSAARQGFTQYVNAGRCFEAMLQIERNECAAASVQLHAALEICDQSGWSIGNTETMGALARSLAALGWCKEALATVDRALTKAEQSQELWYVPELHRIRGEVLLSEKPNEFRLAADCFEKAINLAQEQGALFWELRAAVSLAKLMAAQNERDQARAILRPVYDRCTEGCETADLHDARNLLERASR